MLGGEAEEAEKATLGGRWVVIDELTGGWGVIGGNGG